MARSRRVAWFAALAVLTSTILPSVSYADKLSDAQQKMQNLKIQSQTTKEKISQLKQQQETLRNRIFAIQVRVNTLSRSIVSTQAEIQQRKNKISQLQQEITKTQKHIQQQYGVLANRVRVMYEAGHTTYLSVLFSATSFSDLLSRFQLLSMIAQQDKAVLDGIKASKQHLEAAKQDVEKQQAAEKHAYAILMDEQQQQEAQQATQKALLGQVQDATLKEEASLKSESDAMSNLQSLITQLQSQMGSYSGPSGGWVWPVPGHTYISSGYGWRHWSDGSSEFHNGIDIPAPVGTPIVAATNGKVLYAGPASGFGDWIVIESSGGLIEIYGHMYSWEIKVSPGQDVQTGQQIAGVGSNGFSTGPHLHFTVASGFDSTGHAISKDPTAYVGHGG